MSNGILSQEEIDALLRGEMPLPAAEGEVGRSLEEKSPSLLTPEEVDALGEIGNIAMGSAATALSTLLGKRVSITTPRVKETTRQLLQTEYQVPYVVVKVRYTSGLEGVNLLVIKTEDAAVIGDLMMGGSGLNPSLELNEITLSAVGEAMNQMMGSATTSMSTMFNRRIDISPPVLDLVSLADEQFYLKSEIAHEQLVQISFRMEIENLIDSQIMQIIPTSNAKEMVAFLIESMTGTKKAATAPSPGPLPATVGGMAAGERPTITPGRPGGEGVAGGVPPLTSVPPVPPVSPKPETPAYATMASPSGGMQSGVTVQPAKFAPLPETSLPRENPNLSLIMDIPLQVTVELGRTRKKIKEILEMGPGAIIQLDKLAGEPVDLLVNGKLVAKGEVVVIDENYGVRITAIISPTERINQLQ